MGSHFIKLSLVITFLIVKLDAAPGRSKSSYKSNPHTVFDQKQHGDYNIQVHLKDFQIIALMSDELGGLGDYDYNYDYSDFTVKPSGGSTTTTSTTTSPVTTSQVFSSSPISPIDVSSSSQSYVSPISHVNESPVLHPVSHSHVSHVISSVSSAPLLVSSSTGTSEKTPTSSGEVSEDKPIKTQLTVELSDPKPSASDTPTISKIPSDKPLEISQKPLNSTLIVEEKPLPVTPDKIKVQIIGAPQAEIPGEMQEGQISQGSQQNHGGQQGQQAQKEKRCLTGFTRDKWGRCRRVRRPGGGGSPQIPFDINRLASLASRFRFGSSGTTPPLETGED